MANDPTPKSPEVTSDHLRRWNKLIKYAKDNGYAGRMELDHDDNLRKKVFNDFNKANPADAIPIEMVMPIQNEIQTYKQKALKSIRDNPGSYSGDPNNFMKGISKIDGVFGQQTSQWAFPEAYVVDKATGEKTKLGFANKVNMDALNSAKTVKDFLNR